MADALRRDALVQNGEVHRVEGRIAQTRKERRGQQHGIALCRAGDQTRDRETAQRGKQNGARAKAVYRKAGQRLPSARDNEEQRDQHAEF